MERWMFVEDLMLIFVTDRRRSSSIYRMVGLSPLFRNGLVPCKYLSSAYQLPSGDRKSEDLRLKKVDDGSQTKVVPNHIAKATESERVLEVGNGPRFERLGRRCRSVRFLTRRLETSSALTRSKFLANSSPHPTQQDLSNLCGCCSNVQAQG